MITTGSATSSYEVNIRVPSTRITWVMPTYNNNRMLTMALNSFCEHTRGMQADSPLPAPAVIRVVNNGDALTLSPHPRVTLVESGGGNLGWERGLVKGLEGVTSPYVGFINDDIQVVPGCAAWQDDLVKVLDDHPEVGAVGPRSTFVVGSQHFTNPLEPRPHRTNLLIGFCVLLRREALESAGGVQPGLPGGDDFDLCIRLRGAGYALVIHAGTFLYHHGSQTGARLYQRWWNSQEHILTTRDAIIRKHSLAAWKDTMTMHTEPL